MAFERSEFTALHYSPDYQRTLHARRSHALFPTECSARGRSCWHCLPPMRRQTNTLTWPSFFGQSAIVNRGRHVPSSRGRPNDWLTCSCMRTKMFLAGLLPSRGSGYPRHWAIPQRREERIHSLRLIFSSCTPALTFVHVSTIHLAHCLFLLALPRSHTRDMLSFLGILSPGADVRSRSVRRACGMFLCRGIRLRWPRV